MYFQHKLRFLSRVLLEKQVSGKGANQKNNSTKGLIIRSDSSLLKNKKKISENMPDDRIIVKRLKRRATIVSVRPIILSTNSPKIWKYPKYLGCTTLVRPVRVPQIALAYSPKAATRLIEGCVWDTASYSEQQHKPQMTSQKLIQQLRSLLFMWNSTV